MNWKRAAVAASVCALAALRFAYTGILWVEEAYPIAAAREMLAGKTLYRDVWFDKPPLFPLTYLLWGAQTGWPLRLASALFVVAACWVAARAALRLWGEREAAYTALLLAFFLTFWIPSAVLSLTPDLLMLPLHAGAVALAIAGFPFASGLVAGVAMLVNTKAIFVLAACALWQWRAWPRLVAGFAAPNALILFMPEYRQQVWQWGAAYSRDVPEWATWKEGPLRTFNWAAFHATAVAGAACFWYKERDRRFIAWAALSLAAVSLGWRFFPRYYFHLLPVVVLAGARGLATMPKRWRVAALALLLIPLARFGPRYFNHAQWADLALHEDSQGAAQMLRDRSQSGDTILVWGYRPDIQVLSGLRSGTRFLDSQPLTGVIADRHLAESRATFPELAARNRAALATESPTWIVDGLGPVNPQLAIDRYPDLAPWLARYELVASTRLSRLYRIRRTH